MLSAYALGGLVYALTARRLVQALGQARLAFVGAMVAALALVVLGVTASIGGAFAAIAAVGLGFYMMHNTLQTVATQVAPDARGAAVSLFATCFFVSQAAGVFLGGRVIERLGGATLFAGAAAIVLLVGVGPLVWLRRFRVS